jgi:putative DNA methylase
MSKSKASRIKSTLIECDEFDFEFLSEIAQRESWRKELHRPIYHVHKWWANRLGSVFRGILLGVVLPGDTRLRDQYYKRHHFADRRVLDPFLGSGTTIGEAHKLGFTAFGQDINPVACESVRVVLGEIDASRVQTAFCDLETGVGRRIRSLYTAHDAHGAPCDVLYHFWVKVVACPSCGERTDLFPTRVFARNANPSRRPEVHVCCPGCGDVFQVGSARGKAKCPRCGLTFDADAGEISGMNATCRKCRRQFSIAKTVRASAHPPDHRLYAKLILTASGRKVYLPATEDDLRAYEQCSRTLVAELRAGAIRLPDTGLEDGYNTRQAMGYNYRQWRQFFNDRQLLALGWLQSAIAEIPEQPTRDLLLTLFSGLLEFNNLFASYKGEGTGAVRHMFSHHILKPERMPIEANVWGTARSSGSFLNLYNSRLKRAMEYRNHPFELNATTGERVYGINREFTGPLIAGFPSDGKVQTSAIYLACGSSDTISLPDRSVDLVVTDPPFFDNVHYSELADFFYAWQKLYPRGFVNGSPTTRHPSEVQDADACEFSGKLSAVLKESVRVLRDEGLLVFTYHHSRPDGWSSLLSAILRAGLSVVNCHPVKAEMSVAAPKAQAKEPIQLDAIIVCRKAPEHPLRICSPSAAIASAEIRAREKIERLCAMGLVLSRNDCRVVLMGQLLAELCPQPRSSDAAALLASIAEEIERVLEVMAEHQDKRGHVARPNLSAHAQMQLPFA